jgi:hypothetical protein
MVNPIGLLLDNQHVHQLKMNNLNHLIISINQFGLTLCNQIFYENCELIIFFFLFLY